MKKFALNFFNTVALLLGLYAIFVLPFYIYSTLITHLNFCVSSMSVVSDEDKIKAGVEYFLKNRMPLSVPVYTVRDDGAAIETGEYQEIEGMSYKDADDFLEKNPNCCSLLRFDYLLNWPPDNGFFDKDDVVLIRYQAFYLDTGEVKRIPITYMQRIDACGNVINNRRSR